MATPENAYWSIESCAWVRYTRTDVELPAPREAEEEDETVDLDASDLTAVAPI